MPPEPLAEVQRRFAACIRDSSCALPPDVPPKRMALYRELFLNNVEGFLSSGFPVLRSLHDEARWQALVRDFFTRHRCHTPLFSAIAEEFLVYLAEERAPDPADPPYLLELAHYEWVEMAILVAEDEPPTLPTLPDDARAILDTPLSLSPLAWPLAYRFPVHQIGPGYTVSAPPVEPTCLVVYRGQDESVHFATLAQPAYRLLSLWRDAPATVARSHLARIAAELGTSSSGHLDAMAIPLIHDLIRRGVLGSRPA